MMGVAVTGLGAVTPVGVGVPNVLQALRSGARGFSAPTLDGRTFRCGAFARAAESAALPAPGSAVDDVTRFALAAAREAWEASGGANAPHSPRRMACVIGCGAGGEATHDRALKAVYAEGRERLHPLTLPTVMVSASSSRIAADLNLKGPNFTISSGCASGAHAIIIASQLIRTGEADLVITGGAEAPFALGALRSWEALRVMSPSVSRPFDDDRDGMTLGEGAAMLVLESIGSAQRRGAPILGVITGHGMNCDAGSLLMPDVDGMRDAMEAATARNGTILAPDVIIPHGTGTRANDDAEAASIQQAFGAMALYALKGQVGHMLGASGAFNALMATLLLEDGPPPGALRHLPDGDKGNQRSDAHSPKRVLSNAFAFGGLNTSILVEKLYASS